MKRRLEINGVIIVAAVILIAVFPALFFRHASGVWDTAARLFGFACIILGQVFRVSARGYKAEHSRQGGRLIQGGPYSLVRNPMYLGILLIGTGMVMVLFQWWSAAAFFLIFTLRYILLIFTEEKKLSGLFPQEYSSYKQQVPRLIPKPVSLFRKSIREYLPVKVYWLKKESGTMLAVLLPAIIAEAWIVVFYQGGLVYFKEAGLMAAVLFLAALFIAYLIKSDGKDATVEG